MTRRVSFSTAAVLSLFALVACSGGAGSSESPLPPDPTAVDHPAETSSAVPAAASASAAEAPSSDGIVTTTTPPSAPPAKVPPSAPAACAGMGGTAENPVWVPGFQNDLSPLLLGAGYESTLPDGTHPLFRVRGTVAIGTPQLSPFYGGTSRSSATAGFYDSVTALDFAPIFAPINTTLYRSQTNGEDPPRAWARGFATDPSSESAKLGYSVLSLYRAVRVDLSNLASLGDGVKQGPSFRDAALDQYIRSGHYSRYFAYAIQIRFDSQCKREAFLSRAGGSDLDSVLPATDSRGLGHYLVDAKADIRLGVMTLGQAAATKAVLDATTCSTSSLGQCRALVKSLDALVATTGAGPMPTTFDAKGQNDWFFDSFTPANKSQLAP